MGFEGDAADYALLLLKEGYSVSEGMRSLVSFCRKHDKGDGWKLFEEVDFDADTVRMRRWLESVLRRDPPSHKINGLWFGMFNPNRNGNTSADIYVAGSERYDPKNPDWACDPEYWPEERYSLSQIMATIYEVAYRQTSLGNAAEYPLGLGYCGLIVSELMNQTDRSLTLGEVKARSVGFGFDSGDNFTLGKLSTKGFELSIS